MDASWVAFEERILGLLVLPTLPSGIQGASNVVEPSFLIVKVALAWAAMTSLLAGYVFPTLDWLKFYSRDPQSRKDGDGQWHGALSSTCPETRVSSASSRPLTQVQGRCGVRLRLNKLPISHRFGASICCHHITLRSASSHSPSRASQAIVLPLPLPSGLRIPPQPLRLRSEQRPGPSSRPGQSWAFPARLGSGVSRRNARVLRRVCGAAASDW